MGNFLYSIAYDLESLTILLMGRFLFGMGGARAVNRRYIADFVSMRAMTKYCAAFVAMGALGLAVGPGFASLLSFIPDFVFLGLSFNTYTIPGFISLVMWLCFLIVMLRYFREPNFERANYNKRAKREASRIDHSSRDIEERDAVFEENLDDLERKKRHSFWHTYGPTLLTLYALFLLKIIQEALVTSSPIVMDVFF